MPTRVTVKGQVTLPKAVREAAGIRPGDWVDVRAAPEGGVLVAPADVGSDASSLSAVRKKVDEAAELLKRRRIAFTMNGDEWMRMLRDED